MSSLLESTAADVRYATRALWRAPAFTVVAALTLALGIGANTAVFSIVDGVILRPLPYADAGRLVSIASVVNGAETAVSPRDFVDWRTDARSFVGLAASSSSQTILTGSGDAERRSQARVTANAFDVFGVRALIGRTFVSGEDSVSSPRVAVLSEGLWRRRFGADSNVVGRSLLLDGFPTTVVGIAPAAMQWPEPVDVWLTTRFNERDLSPSARGQRSVTVVGRLAPGASLPSARAEMRSIARRLQAVDPAHNTNVGVELAPLLSRMVSGVRTPLFILLGAVGFVLLIACANVGGLAISRIAARDAELALRTALGASRGRIVRQLLTESILLAAVGGALGLGLAVAGIDVAVAMAPAGVPRLDSVALDARVLLFTFAVTALTGLFFGLAPALHGSTRNLHDRLRNAGRGTRGSKSAARSRRVLVVVQVTLAIVLLAGAGLLVRSLVLLRNVDPGFRADGVVAFGMGQLPRSYSTKEREIAFTTTLLDRVRRIPGVTAADMSFNLPLEGSGPRITFTVRGVPDDPKNQPRAEARAAGPQYFAAMGIPLLRGRLFDANDRSSGAPVLVISAEMARRQFGSEDPIGKYVETNWSGPGWSGQRFGGQVIGVVGDVRQRALDGAVASHMYMPYAQWPVNEYDVVIRSRTASADVLRETRAALQLLDPNLPMNDVRTLRSVIDGSLGDRRFFLNLLGAFAGIAVLLALVGLYGVVAYGVQQRRREVGIRLALGATPARVRAMILSEGLHLVAAGVGLGIVAALALTRVLQALLFSVSPRDPMTFVAAPVLLTLAAALACVLPARQAARVDPAETMRSD